MRSVIRTRVGCRGQRLERHTSTVAHAWLLWHWRNVTGSSHTADMPPKQLMMALRTVLCPLLLRGVQAALR
jgi:hypothetical protein